MLDGVTDLHWIIRLQGAAPRERCHLAPPGRYDLQHPILEQAASNLLGAIVAVLFDKTMTGAFILSCMITVAQPDQDGHPEFSLDSASDDCNINQYGGPLPRAVRSYHTPPRIYRRCKALLW